MPLRVAHLTGLHGGRRGTVASRMGINQPNLKFDHAYAIIRIDRGGVDSSGRLDLDLLTVVKVVKLKETADREVERLTRVNSGKHCIYVSQITRLERPE